MITGLNASAENFLVGLAQIEQRSQQAQRQLTSGLRLQNISDDPDQVSNVLATRAQIGRNEQIKFNLGRVKTEVDAGERALSRAAQILDRVRVLGAQGDTGTQTAATREVVANEIGSLLQELVGIAGTNVEGRYIFSGDSDQKVPYTIDLTQTNPTGAYAGSAATRQIEHPDGTLFQVSRTAQTIFDNGTPQNNVFASINALRVGLLSNNQAAIDAALPNISTSSDFFNTQLAFYGNTQNRVTEATDFGSKLGTQLQAQLGTLQDVDITAAILELTQSKTQQEAALASEARLPRTTLFDFLA